MTVTISKTLLKKDCLMGCHIAASVVRSPQLTSTVQRGQCSLDGKLSPSRGLYGLGYRSIVSSLRIQSLRQAIATTFDTYSHVPPGMQDEAALRFDQGIAKAQNERPQDCSWGLLSYLNFGSGGWIRTNDLRVMSPTSCHCSTPRRNKQSAFSPHRSSPRGAGRMTADG